MEDENSLDSTKIQWNPLILMIMIKVQRGKLLCWNGENLLDDILLNFFGALELHCPLLKVQRKSSYQRNVSSGLADYKLTQHNNKVCTHVHHLKDFW